MNDLITVIVPVYKTKPFLKRCVDSITSQTHKNLEIILVDDGCPIGSGDLCDELAATDHRIKVVHKENGGVSTARNTGLSEAKGEYVLFVDSDDYLYSNDVCSLCFENINKSGADVCAFLWQYVDTDGRFVIDKNKCPKEFDGRTVSAVEFARLLYGDSYANVCVVSVCNKLYKKRFIENKPFDGKYKIGEDENWAGEVYSQNGKVFCDADFGYVYCRNEGSLTFQSFGNNNVLFLEILKKRTEKFSDEYILKKTKKLFLDLYIEYYYKAEKAGIAPYKDKACYKKYRKELSKTLTSKTKLRYLLFALSPKLYKLITRIK